MCFSNNNIDDVVAPTRIYNIKNFICKFTMRSWAILKTIKNQGKIQNRGREMCFDPGSKNTSCVVFQNCIYLCIICVSALESQHFGPIVFTFGKSIPLCKSLNEFFEQNNPIIFIPGLEVFSPKTFCFWTARSIFSSSFPGSYFV